MSQTAQPAVILVVEDNLANQMLVDALLMGLGYHVRFASSASEALTSIVVERPDLILMDVQLPGQDGLSLTRQLKADPATSAIPIVALTAHAMASDRDDALSAGCVGYISKPIDTRTLAELVRGFLAPATASSSAIQ